jgi:hypothetical protein
LFYVHNNFANKILHIILCSQWTLVSSILWLVISGVRTAELKTSTTVLVQSIIHLWCFLM